VSPAAYEAGHIEGAVLCNVYRDLKDTDYRLVDRSAVEALFTRSGIGPDSIVVFYGYAPVMAMWLMKLYGHRDARLLDGSRETWRDAGRPWTAVGAPVGTPPTQYRLPAADPRLRADVDAVRAAIDDPNVTLVDVRSRPEYDGERFWPSDTPEPNGRAGHVPSAIHVPIDDLRDETGAFRPRVDLAHVFAGTGPGPLISRTAPSAAGPAPPGTC
jgi:thiosulfate/3-mercaptopyruvate sulfurtransferase